MHSIPHFNNHFFLCSVPHSHIFPCINSPYSASKSHEIHHIFNSLCHYITVQPMIPAYILYTSLISPSQSSSCCQYLAHLSSFIISSFSIHSSYKLEHSLKHWKSELFATTYRPNRSHIPNSLFSRIITVLLTTFTFNFLYIHVIIPLTLLGPTLFNKLVA